MDFVSYALDGRPFVPTW